MSALAVLAAFLGNKGQRRVAWISAAILIAFVGLRDESVGTDTSTYVLSFLHPEVDYGNMSNPGFKVLLYILNFLLAGNQNIFIFVTAAASLAGITLLSLRASKAPAASLLLFSIMGTATIFLFHTMSGIRQALIESLFLYVLYKCYGNPSTEVYNIKRNVVRQRSDDYVDSEESGRSFSETPFFWTACLLMLVASSIHTTSLLTIPFLYFASKSSLSRAVWFILIAASYVLGAQNMFSMQDIIFSSLNAISQLFGSTDAISHYLVYGTTFTEGAIESTGLINYASWPFALIGLFICVVSGPYWIRSRYTTILLAGIVCNNLFCDNILWGRIFIYFLLPIAVVLPNILHNVKWWISIPAYVGIVAFYIYKCNTMLLSQLINKDGNVVCPYDSYLFSFY